MRVVFFAACRRLTKSLGAVIALILIGAVVAAQTPTPSPDQLNILKNLTPEQQDALLQSVLGKGDGTQKATRNWNRPRRAEEKRSHGRRAGTGSQ